MENIKEELGGILPEVTVIFLDCNEEEIRRKEEDITYPKIKIESVSVLKEGIMGIFLKILYSDNEYICFGESGKRTKQDKIEKMIKFFTCNEEVDTVLCLNEYRDEHGFITEVEDAWQRFLDENEKNIFQGAALLRMSLIEGINYYGNLENCMIRKSAFVNKMFLINEIVPRKSEEKLLFMYECLFGLNVGILTEALVVNYEETLNFHKAIEDYDGWKRLRTGILSNIKEEGEWEKSMIPTVYSRMAGVEVNKICVENECREITFFYTDLAEYYNLAPVAQEAERRGYQVEMTQEIDKKVKIGVYCSHVGLLKNAGINAEFSVILLHDMTQGELNWPALWNYEPWNEFDIGILPGKQWAERWKRCSGFYYAHPKYGVYELGYPKGDYAKSEELGNRVKELRNDLQLKYKYSILYAPSWEYAGKEDDFIKACSELEVNLLVKQIRWSERYRSITENIEKMRELHEGKYENLYYIEPEENILAALAICDLVVSDESSVMTEALLFGKPSIAVMDWLIPDVTPARESAVPFDYVYKCKKAELREKVKEILDRIKEGKEQINEDVFSNIGNSCSDIMDLIEYYTGARETCDCLTKEVQPIYQFHGVWD